MDRSTREPPTIHDSLGTGGMQQMWLMLTILPPESKSNSVNHLCLIAEIRPPASANEGILSRTPTPIKVSSGIIIAVWGGLLVLAAIAGCIRPTITLFRFGDKVGTPATQPVDAEERPVLDLIGDSLGE